MELLSTIPEEYQKEMQQFLWMNFCNDNPYEPLSKNEILLELAQLLVCYEPGEREDFDKQLMK
ncbi:hypothetical protein AALA98_14010 [Lachnospiraceae bacterium 45-W7]